MNVWSSPRIAAISSTDRNDGMRLAYTCIGRPSTVSVVTSNIPPGPVRSRRTSSMVGTDGSPSSRRACSRQRTGAGVGLPGRDRAARSPSSGDLKNPPIRPMGTGTNPGATMSDVTADLAVIDHPAFARAVVATPVGRELLLSLAVDVEQGDEAGVFDRLVEVVDVPELRHAVTTHRDDARRNA